MKRTFPLPYTTPPLTANQRLHHMQRARITKQLRHTAAWLTKKHVPQGLEHITVTLTYTPKDNRRRDADNLVPTLKAICDGIVDAGVVPDDTPKYMTKHMPVIAPANRNALHRLKVTIEWKQP